MRVASTTNAGHATELAAEAAEAGIEVVAACGGDGTVNEVVQALGGTPTALAVLPAGTANVWAREAGVPLDVGRAISFIPSARAERVDLGVVEGEFGSRRFLLMCGIGLDAEVVRGVGTGSRGKRWLGKGWYGVVGARTLGRWRSVRCELRVDSVPTEMPVFQLVVGNTRLFGGMFRLTSDARIDDGLLDVCAFWGRGRIALGRMLWRARGGHLHARTGHGIEYLRGERVDVASSRRLAVQADGEYVGETPVTLSVEPRSLTVLIGTRPNALLGERA